MSGAVWGDGASGLKALPEKTFEAEDFVRWSYATSMDNIVEGLERLKKFLSGKYE